MFIKELLNYLDFFLFAILFSYTFFNKKNLLVNTIILLYTFIILYIIDYYVEISYILVWSLILFGSVGYILKNNFIMFIISLELYLLAINFNFIFCSLKMGETTGVLVSLVLLVLGALDTAVGLSLLVKYYNISLISDINLSKFINLKG